jgi:hypothetical protein
MLAQFLHEGIPEVLTLLLMRGQQVLKDMTKTSSERSGRLQMLSWSRKMQGVAS